MINGWLWKMEYCKSRRLPPAHNGHGMKHVQLTMLLSINPIDRSNK